MKKRLPPHTRPPERSGAAEVRINSAATPSLAGRSADSGPYRLITAEYNLGGVSVSVSGCVWARVTPANVCESYCKYAHVCVVSCCFQ